MNPKIPRYLPGFTLIELAIVLIIIGVIAGAVLKGQDLLEAAKMRGLLADANRFRMVVQLYHENYGALPGDDAHAAQHFGAQVSNGDGDGIISNNDSQLFWTHLAKAGHVGQSEPPSSKFGGTYQVVYNPSKDLSGHWFMLSGPQQQGVLTPKQALLLKSKAGDQTATSDSFRLMNGKNAGTHPCLGKDGQPNLSHDRPTCVVLWGF